MKFTHPSEARGARPDLDTASAMRVDQYATLIAECNFPDLHYVVCQLIDDKGHACRQKFGKGWVARRTDGVEVLIGGRCAQKHFLGAGDESLRRFTEDAALLVRRNKLNDALARLNAFMTDVEYAQRLRHCAERLAALRLRTDQERSSLPHAVLERLKWMVRTGTRGVPGGERHLEKVENRDGTVVEVERWRPMTFGNVANPDAIFASSLAAASEVLNAAQRTLEASVEAISEDLSALSGRLNSLAAGERCTSMLDAAEAAINAFVTPENFRVICWLARDEDDRKKVVARALQLAGKSSKPHDAKLTLQQWAREIRAGNGDRVFRPEQ